MKRFRAGVDIGGTFTDIVLLGDRGERYTKKVSSTVDDYARAITEGLSQLLAEIGGEARGIAELLHGTTVASNAILEHKGAKTGLITTKGFRDVLEIRNLRMTNRRGCANRARPIATRCFSPPDRLAGLRVSNSAMPSKSMTCSTSPACPRREPNQRPYNRFCRTVRCGKSLPS